jgi:hypothetical protein
VNAPGAGDAARQSVYQTTITGKLSLLRVHTNCAGSMVRAPGCVTKAQ